MTITMPSVVYPPSGTHIKEGLTIPLNGVASNPTPRHIPTVTWSSFGRAVESEEQPLPKHRLQELFGVRCLGITDGVCGGSLEAELINLRK